MANTIITPNVIAKEALMQLENNCVMGKQVHREYRKEFSKVGDEISIRKPVKFVTTDGATRVNQDVIEGKTNIKLQYRKHVSWSFSTLDLTLSVSDFSERYVKPAVIALAQDVNSSLTSLYKSIWNFSGTPGTTPSTFNDLAAVGQLMDEGAVPMSDRVGVLNPATAWKLADGLKGVYVQQKAKNAFEEATVGRYAGFDNFNDQSIKVHTVGAHGGTPLVKGALQSVTYLSVKDTNAQSLLTDGWPNSITGVLKAGDVFTLAGVFAVNPVTKESTGALQRFVVNADVDSDGSGNATLNISPAIIISGPYQTVTAAPADNAAIVVKTGTASTGYAQNLFFHKNALALVTVPLVMPDSVSWKAQESHNGYSIRVIKDYDKDSDEEIIRLDMLWGVKAIYPELAARLTA